MIIDFKLRSMSCGLILKLMYILKKPARLIYLKDEGTLSRTIKSSVLV